MTKAFWNNQLQFILESSAAVLSCPRSCSVKQMQCLLHHRHSALLPHRVQGHAACRGKSAAEDSLGTTVRVLVPLRSASMLKMGLLLAAGGPVPEGADAVVQIENTEQLPPGQHGKRRVRIVKVGCWYAQEKLLELCIDGPELDSCLVRPASDRCCAYQLTQAAVFSAISCCQGKDR